MSRTFLASLVREWATWRPRWSRRLERRWDRGDWPRLNCSPDSWKFSFRLSSHRCHQIVNWPRWSFFCCFLFCFFLFFLPSVLLRVAANQSIAFTLWPYFFFYLCHCRHRRCSRSLAACNVCRVITHSNGQGRVRQDLVTLLGKEIRNRAPRDCLRQPMWCVSK